MAGWKGLLRSCLGRRWPYPAACPVHLLHIGKTGGSAVKFALADHSAVEKQRIILHRHRTSLSDIPEGEKVCFFLRDPVSRFVSAFYSRQRKGQPRYNSEWNVVERDVFGRFATANDLAMALADKDSSQHDLALRAMDAIGHFQPYRKWYGSLDEFCRRQRDVLFVGFQEQLGTDFARFLHAVGIREELQLPDDDVAAHRNPAHADRSVSEPGAAALKDWYAEDYEFIALCKELMDGRGC